MRNALLMVVCLICFGCVDSKQETYSNNQTVPKYKYTVLSMGVENRSYDKVYYTNSYTRLNYGISFLDSNGKETFVSGNIRVEEQ